MKKLGLVLLASFAAMAGAGDAVASQDRMPGCTAAIAYSKDNRGLAVLVLQNGRVVCQSRNTEEAHELWSGTKSLVGLMAAAAVQDGLLELDERASDTLDEWRDDPIRSTITLRQLLSMTSGHPSTIGRPQGYADSFQIAPTSQPGKRFQYGPTPLQIFGEVMRRKLKEVRQVPNPRFYIERRLFSPLGIDISEWRNGPDGQPLMPQGVVMSATQWAKVGEFVRVGGKLGNRSLVDPETLKALFVGSAANPAYGLTWWLPRITSATDHATQSTDITDPAAGLPPDMVVSAGAGAQRLYVIPSRGMTIVRQARLDMAAVVVRRKSEWSDVKFLSLLLAK